MKLTVTFIFSFLVCLSLSAQDAKEIIRKSDELLRGESSIAEITMKIVRPSWERTMKMKAWTLGDEFALILIEEPVKEKGTVFLKRSDELWNWIPRISRTIKLPPSMMSQSWMGTDMSNDDLVKQSSILKDYTHKVIGKEDIEGRSCHIIEMIPTEEAAVVWGKIVVWVDAERFIQMKVEQYDEDFELMATTIASDIKSFGKRLLPAKLEIIPSDEPGNKTILEYLSLEFDMPMKEEFFSQQNMKRIR